MEGGVSNESPECAMEELACGHIFGGKSLSCLFFFLFLLLPEWKEARLVAAVLAEVEQLRKAVEAASALQEVVAYQFPGAGSRFDVHA